MADFSPTHALGEDVLKLNDNMVVEYGENGIKAGDFLIITGVNSDNQPIVKTQTASLNSRFVAMFKGELNDFRTAMIRGQIKITFGASVTPGADFMVTGNKVFNAAGTGVIAKKGFNISNGAADLDTGDVYFDGTSSLGNIA